MGSPNGGSSNNFGSVAGVISALNETNKKLRLLIDVLCCQSNGGNTGSTQNTYNKVDQHLVNEESGPLTFSANTVHSISYLILSGQFNISINATVINCPEGYSSSESASGLISSTYIFTPLDSSSSAIIITISA